MSSELGTVMSAPVQQSPSSPSYLDPLSTDFVETIKACINPLRRQDIFGRPLQACSNIATELLVQLKYVKGPYMEMCERIGKYIVAILLLMGKGCAEEIRDEGHLSQFKSDNIKQLQTIMKSVLKLAKKASPGGSGLFSFLRSHHDQSSVERELQRRRNKIQGLFERNQTYTDIDVDSLVNRTPHADSWRALATFSQEKSKAIREAIAPLGRASSTGPSSPGSAYNFPSTSLRSNSWNGAKTPQPISHANRGIVSNTNSKVENSYNGGDSSSARVPITQTNENVRTSGDVSNSIMVNSNNGSHNRNSHNTWSPGSANFGSSRSSNSPRSDEGSSSRRPNVTNHTTIDSGNGSYNTDCYNQTVAPWSPGASNPSPGRSPEILPSPPYTKFDPNWAQRLASILPVNPAISDQ